MYILANHGIVYAWPYHSFCRILLAFAGQYCGSAPGGGFRHSEVNSVSNIHHKIKKLSYYSDFRSTMVATCSLTPWGMVPNF